jgi:hypothetical protein
MMKRSYFYPVIFCFCSFLVFCCSKNSQEDISGQDADQNVEESGETADLTADADNSSKSFYRIHILMKDGTDSIIERDITENPVAFSFGSTHIAPAISFTVEDTIYSPTYMIITFNFGIIFGSTQYPVQTPETGDYDFAAYPPEIRVFVKNIQYKSTVSGSSGKIHLTEWGVYTGDVFAGTFEGRILQETGKQEKLYLDIDGSFHFVLPELQQGQ